MLEIVLSVFVVLLAFAYGFAIGRPRKIKENYARKFREAGWKVYELPENYFGNPIMKIIAADSRKGDAFLTLKQIYSEHDVIIGNSLNRIELTLTNPQLINEFALHQQDYFYRKRRIIVDNLRRAVGDGVVFAEKESWKRKRKILSKIITHTFVVNKLPQISKICQENLQRVQAMNKNNGKTQKDGSYSGNLLDFSGPYVSDVIIQCVLGGKYSNEKIEGKSIAEMLLELKREVNLQSTSLIGYFLGAKFFSLGLREEDRKINKKIKKFDEWGINLITKSLSEIDKEELKSSKKPPKNMIEALVSNEDEEDQFTCEDILQQFKNFHMAGTNFVSHYIQMAMVYLCQNPTYLSIVRKEIQEFLPLGIQGSCSYSDISKMKYLDAVLKQTTRLYGPSNFNLTRCTEKDHTLGKVPIYASTLIKYNSMGIHYNPQNYQNPRIFDPSRWVNEECSTTDPLKLIGFGVGNRSCIGKLLGILQAKVAIIQLLRRYPQIRLMNKEVKLTWRLNYVPQNAEFKFIPQKQ